MERRRFTDAEKQLIAQEYSAGTSVSLLAQKLDRTQGSIRYLIHHLRVKGKKIVLLREEIEFLKEMVINELPFRFLYNSYVKKANEMGWVVRSKNSIGSILYRHKEFQSLKKRSGDYWSLNIISSALKCSVGAIILWFRDAEYKTILDPVVMDGGYYIRPKNLARFCRQFPGEIAKYEPDILWLIDLLSDK